MEGLPQVAASTGKRWLDKSRSLAMIVHLFLAFAVLAPLVDAQSQYYNQAYEGVYQVCPHLAGVFDAWLVLII